MATAKLLNGGHGQAVQLPEDFHFEGTEVNVERDPVTGGVVLSPLPKSVKGQEGWGKFFDMVLEHPAEEEFLADRNDELLLPRDVF